MNRAPRLRVGFLWRADGLPPPCLQSPEAYVLKGRVLVLNKSWTAVGTTSARRAMILLFQATAEAIDADTFGQYDIEGWIKRPARADENTVKTPRFELALPLVIRLLTYARVPRLRIALTRRNIFRRDNHSCQYCGLHLPPAHLTVDHVVARSRGGTTTWENVVTACGRCNRRKGSRRPEEAGLALASRPAIPNWDPVLASSPDPIRPEWKRFLFTHSDN